MNPPKIRRSLLCLAILLLCSLAGICQEITPASTGFPVPRTLTSSDGRKLDVTLLDKTATTIKAKRVSDGVEFTLELAKLSADDQAFIAGLAVPNASVAAPTSPAGNPATASASGKVRVLHIGRRDFNTRPALEAAGYEIVPMNTDELKKLGMAADLSVLENVDVIWTEFGITLKEHKVPTLLIFNEANRTNKIVVTYSGVKIDKADISLDKEPERPNNNTFSKVDENFIIFNPLKWSPSEKEPTIDPKIINKLFQEFTGLVKTRQQTGLIKGK